MKKLKDLKIGNKIDVRELMALKGGYDGGDPRGCDNHACKTNACTGTSCLGNTCTTEACVSAMD